MSKLLVLIVSGAGAAAVAIWLYFIFAEQSLQEAVQEVVGPRYAVRQPLSEIDNQGKWLPPTWFSFLFGFYNEPSKNQCYEGVIVSKPSYKKLEHDYNGNVQASLTRDLGDLVKADFSQSDTVKLVVTDMIESELSKVRFRPNSACAIQGMADYEVGRVDRVIVGAVRAHIEGREVKKRDVNADGSGIDDQQTTVIEAPSVFLADTARYYETQVKRTALGRVAWKVDEDLIKDCSFSITDPVRAIGGDQRITGWVGKASCLGWNGEAQDIGADFNQWASVGPMGDGVTAGIKAKLDPDGTNALIVDIAIWSVLDR